MPLANAKTGPATPTTSPPGLHVAIIMDGNGRWAERQQLPRVAGHQRGVDSVRRTTEEAARLNIEQLTLYMNKVRQAAITHEIIEVVSGAAAT